MVSRVETVEIMIGAVLSVALAEQPWKQIELHKRKRNISVPRHTLSMVVEGGVERCRMCNGDYRLG